MLTNSLSATLALRAKPLKKTALPSRRVSRQPLTVAPTVPSKKSAAERPTAQSPPDGCDFDSRDSVGESVGESETKERAP
jgi:hypothetical protein